MNMDKFSEKIIKTLSNEIQGITESSLFDKIQGRRASKVKALRELLQSGTISRHGNGKRGCPYLYSLNENQSEKQPETRKIINQDDLRNAVELFKLLLKIQNATS